MLDLFELLESTNELHKVLVILWRKTREYANRYETWSEKRSNQSTSSSEKLCAMKLIFYHQKNAAGKLFLLHEPGHLSE